ncbi:MAG: hypothetical protein ABFS32_07225 [Bacteroidota bacterium]
MKVIRIILLLALPFIFLSCSDDPEDIDPGNVIIITEDIVEPTTWLEGNVYLIKAWDFYVENTLSIEPGVIVKFHPSDGPYMMLSGSGTIVANGTSSKPIIFTSFKDDAHGGDTNGDGGATTPSVKDWGNINTNGANGSSFKYCEFYYGGNSTYSSTLAIESGSIAAVENCIFAHNAGDNATGWYGALSFSSAGKGSTLKGNTFYDNVRPLSVMADMNVPDDQVFHDPANQSVTNKYNGIFVETINETTEANVSWMETEVPFIIDDNDWWIETGASIQLGNNVVLKFKPGSVLLLEDGTSDLINNNGTGVYFTSYKDDSKLGDTNGDGSATSPAKGDWGGIYDNTSDYLSWVNILYAQNP